MATTVDNVQVNILANASSAINTLGKLEMEANELKNSMKGLKKGTAEYVESSKSLKEVTDKIKEVRQEAGLAGMTLTQLTRYQRELRREIGNMTRGTDAYNQLNSRLQEVNRSVRAQRDELSGNTGLWKKIGAEIKQFGVMALTYLGAQEIIGQVGNLISSNAKLSDSIADVQKTTGLAKEQVEALNNEFKKIDTRTSRTQLLDLAKIAGKLGVEGKENVLGFVKAADQIVVALGEDLGGDAEGTIRQVGKLVDVFKVKDEFGLEQGLLKVGSAINALGAASTASEAFLVDFSKRLGGIAPNANISISQVLGLAATLDQLGQTSESSSTAMGQLLVSFAQDIPAFSKIAGVSVKEFSDLLATDANEALLMVLEGAKSTTGGLAGMAQTLTKLGVDGARAASVVGVLSNNTDLLREQQALANREFVAGTSLTNEFAIKNNTLAASLEKLQKRIAGAFVNSGFLKFLSAFIEGIEKATRANEDLSDGLRAQEKQLVLTRAQFDAEFRVLKSGNLTTEEKNKLMTEMNRKYKDLLPSMLTEKTTTSDINTLQATGLHLLKQKILLKAQEATLTEKMNQIANNEIANERDRQALMSARIKTEMQRAKSPNGAESTFASSGLSGGLTNVETQLGQAIRQEKALEANILKRDEENKKIQESINKESALYKQVLDRINLPNGADGTKTPDNETPTDDKNDDDAPKKKTPFEQSPDRLLKEWEEFYKKVKAIEERYAGDKNPQAAMEAKYQNMRDVAFRFYQEGLISDEQYQQQLIIINKAYLKESVDAHTEALRIKAEADRKAADERKKLAEHQAAEEKKAADERKKLAEHQADEDKKAREAQLKADVDLWNARSGLLSEFSSLITATNQLISAQGAKQSAFQKELAIVQIAIDTAASISKAIAGATAAAALKGPAAPFVLAGYIVSMVASVIGAVAKAKAVLSTAKTPKTPSYYYGGNTKGTGVMDSDGRELAGLVHANEYVVPEALMGNPIVADMVAIIEGLRTGKGMGRTTAQSAGNIAPTIPSVPQGNAPQNTEMMNELKRFNTLMERMERDGFRAYFTRKEFEDADEYIGDIESNRQESRL